MPVVETPATETTASDNAVPVQPPAHTATPATNTSKASDAPVSESAPQPSTPTKTPAYTYPPLSFDVVHTAALPTIVNIICLPTKGSGASGATGTGIIISADGVVLTNAHVAQYLVLKDYPTPNSVSCILRTGSPARPAFSAHILYFPSAWAREHPHEYDSEFATGTGEHDWALLRITDTTTAYHIGSLPFITPDTRSDVSTINNEVLVAGYPAGFLGSQSIAHDLWPVSTIATIRQLFTFGTNSPDVFGVGGTIVAQAGISGSPAINAWGRLVGIAVTASEGATTGDRDLRFLSLAYIDIDIQSQTGLTLAQFISGDLNDREENFYAAHKDELLQLLTNK
jgi:S1-C subfamily serine protease